MIRTSTVKLFCAVTLLGLIRVAAADPDTSASGNVTEQRVLEENQMGDNWLINGGTVFSEHFSPLDEVNTTNAGQLGLAWWLTTNTPDGLAATPIVVDGAVYLSGPFSKVFAVDARSGTLIWEYDPKVDLGANENVSWTAHVNRGVAVWHHKVLVATADCHLIALSADTGKPVWNVKTCDPALGYSISGAPYVGGDEVFIGNGGSESGKQTRGYVTAYNVDSGKLDWRFYTAPSATPADNKTPAMIMGAKSWSGDALQKYGGGATVWDSMSYDPYNHLLYFGTGGTLPYVYSYRSPAGGDNLFTSSVMAVNAETGKYVWHYQTVNHDNWDYNADNNIILANLKIKGRLRKVLMIAPKNGFLYVLDRNTGELLSAAHYTKVNWAKGIDMKTGRPIPAAGAEFWKRPGKTTYVYPNTWGSHSWEPMAWDPKLKLLYIPSVDLPDEVKYEGGADYDSHIAYPPASNGKKMVPARLVAWDPVTQSLRWSADRTVPFNGGVLATAGGLVFQGTGSGKFQAFSADKGKLLWSTNTQSSITAAPVSYMVDDQQYILVATGGGGGIRYGYSDLNTTPASRGPSRLIAYRLQGEAVLPEESAPAQAVPTPPAMNTSPEMIATGAALYGDKCSGCHGPDAVAVRGTIPDLRYIPPEIHKEWNAIVLGGMLREKGMIPFNLTADQALDIEAYVVQQARNLLNKN